MAFYYVGDFPQPYPNIVRARKEAIDMARKVNKHKEFASEDIPIKSSNGWQVRKPTVGILTYAKWDNHESKSFAYIPVKDGTKMKTATNPSYVDKNGKILAKSKVRF